MKTYKNVKPARVWVLILFLLTFSSLYPASTCGSLSSNISEHSNKAVIKGDDAALSGFGLNIRRGGVRSASLRNRTGESGSGHRLILQSTPVCLHTIGITGSSLFNRKQLYEGSFFRSRIIKYIHSKDGKKQIIS